MAGFMADCIDEWMIADMRMDG